MGARSAAHSEGAIARCWYAWDDEAPSGFGVYGVLMDGRVSSTTAHATGKECISVDCDLTGTGISSQGDVGCICVCVCVCVWTRRGCSCLGLGLVM